MLCNQLSVRHDNVGSISLTSLLGILQLYPSSLFLSLHGFGPNPSKMYMILFVVLHLRSTGTLNGSFTSSSRRDERHSRRDERRHVARRRCVRYKELKYRRGRHCGSGHGDKCREVGSCVVRVRCVCRVIGEARIGRGIVEEGKRGCWAVSRDCGVGSCIVRVRCVTREARIEGKRGCWAVSRDCGVGPCIVRVW